MRFSVCTFSPPLVSTTTSVGTTMSSKYGARSIDWIRCSRLARALFSCPEYVLITYHFLASISGWVLSLLGRGLAEPGQVDQGRPDEVEYPDVGSGDGHRDDDDHGGLHEFLPRGPRHLAHLGAHFPEETRGPPAPRRSGAGNRLGGLRCGHGLGRNLRRSLCGGRSGHRTSYAFP